MPRPPVISLDNAIERSRPEQAEDPYRPPTTSALTPQIESSRQRPANIPGHHFRVNPYVAASAESDEDSDSDSDDSGLQIKFPSSKRPADEPRQMVTPTLRRRPNADERNPQATRGNTLHAERPGRQRIEESDSDDGGLALKNTSSKRPADRPRQTMTLRPHRRPNADESNPQPTRGNTLHAERPQRQRNEEIPSERLARIPTSDLLFEGQILDESPTPQKPQVARAKPPPPQGEKTRQQPHDDPRPRRPAPISIADILNRGTTNFQRPQAAQRPSKPAPKPHPQEPESSSSLNPKKPTGLAIPHPLSWGFRGPPKPSKPAPKPQPEEPKSESSSSSSLNPKKPTGLAIPHPLSWGFRGPPKPSKPAPKPQPQPKEPKPSSSSSQNPKKAAPLPIPQPLHLGFPRPPRPTQTTQLQSATAQGRQPAEAEAEEEESDDEPILRRRDRRRATRAQRTVVSDNRAGNSESDDDDVFVFRGDGVDGMGGKKSDLKSAGR